METKQREKIANLSKKIIEKLNSQGAGLGDIAWTYVMEAILENKE